MKKPLRITMHAAKRILERDLNAKAVLKAAERALKSGVVPKGGKARVKLGKVTLVLGGNSLITVIDGTSGKYNHGLRVEQHHARERARLAREEAKETA